MKMKKGIIAVALMMCLLAACNPGYTKELGKQVKAENEEKGMALLKEKVPDAKSISMDTHPSGSSLYNVVEGHYKVNKQYVGYYLNVDTGEMFTDEDFERVETEYKRRLCEDYGLISGNVLECKLHVTESMDAVSIYNIVDRAETEVQKVNTTISVDALNYSITDAEIAEIYENASNNRHIYITYKVDSFDGIEDESVYMKMCTEHPELWIMLYDNGKGKEMYYVVDTGSTGVSMTKHVKADGSWTETVVKEEKGEVQRGEQ